MLHLTPDEVGEDRVDHVPDVSGIFFDYAVMKSYCPDGVWGRASRATAEKGRQAMEIMVQETVKHIQSTIVRLDQLETTEG